MSAVKGWPPAAQQEAWFAAWVRAIRSGNTASAEVAAAQLRLLGVEVSVIPQESAP